MSLYRAIGIDPSISGTGIVLLQENGTSKPELLVEHEIKPEGKGLERTRSIAINVLKLVHNWQPDAIVLEGYSLGKNPNSTIPLVELGGILRLMMMIDGLKWYDPRASKLKKFVTGKGNTQKDQMMMYVLKRWDHTSMTNNTADAYGLACMGLAVKNRLPGITQEMRAVSAEMELRCH
ncbi:crossover junction endodeoxyribonuclease RuvC [Hyphomicrobium sp.]|uniref:crossover junction endodeoxyribonuclease RuvC n=1 Tax=Hyphomicrobium sp. TaxID=82 RepID=UPI001D85C009|nr:crossover junction endodeoxyribonuclease RuvC [Hyphomicrobium sp.]MBY0560039.1 crossover junction endodeoxyribonuclease RuvC [Hyphomicrobium sp.]